MPVAKREPTPSERRSIVTGDGLCASDGASPRANAPMGAIGCSKRSGGQRRPAQPASRGMGVLRQRPAALATKLPTERLLPKPPNLSTATVGQLPNDGKQRQNVEQNNGAPCTGTATVRMPTDP
jgi:hypothetical protein